MLQNYQEEVRHKRNAHRIFWCVVFGFAFLLYMFFQGYYFSVQVGFQALFHSATHSSTGTSSEQVVRSFGIVNIQVDPNPNVLTINNLPYQNGDKSIFDYGEYRIDIEHPEYVPIHIKTVLNKQNPFYINIIRLLKTPKATELPKYFESVETLSNGKYLVNTLSGSLEKNEVFDATFLTGSTLSWSTNSGNLTYIGDRYFRSGEKLLLYDETLDLVRPYDRPKTESGTLCPDLRSINGDLFCPGNGQFLTGKYATSKERILEVNDRIIRTATSVSQNGGGFFDHTFSLSGSLATMSGSTDIVRIGDESYLLTNHQLWNASKTPTQKIIDPFERIDTIANFPDETLIFGKTANNVSLFSLLDGHGNTFSLNLPGYELDKANITKHSGAYIINTGTEVFLYYKGATNITPLATGKILGVFDRIILFNRDEKTYRMELEWVD